jgi:ABC-2 type transport system ATP-binding protein
MLRFAGVSKSFGGLAALRDVSFEAAAGTLTAVVGADGAGKSTLLRAALGLIRPDAGRVFVAGRPIDENLAGARRMLGYMPERFSLYPDLTVEETMALVADIHGLDRGAGRDRSEALLRRTGLRPFAARRVGRLSGGMRQKLALSAALVPEPKAVLLDEPTAGIDPFSREELFGEFRALAGMGTAVLLTTSSFDEAARADAVIQLWNGRTILDGPVGLLEASHGRPLPEIGLERELRAEREIPG